MIERDADSLGATPSDDGRCRFKVWAPHHARVEVCIIPEGRIAPMTPCEGGYHSATVHRVSPGSRYTYRLSGHWDRPDPASRAQPEGVHGQSEVVDLHYDWTDGDWQGRELSDFVIYELHVGTFTSAGTFDAVIDDLDRLAELGVTAVEVMPVAQFPGTRNWGYDGVYPFAVQTSYGGFQGLQRLVDACHARGLAVVLDVVYNHLGPEGNYLPDYGSYFTDAYHTPWGKAVNFDGPGSDHVRRYFIENAIQWVRDFHIDALRLDAVHAIMDRSPYPFLEELAETVHMLQGTLNRRILLIAESDANDPRLIRGADDGGMGLDAMWCDDLHHAVHAVLTEETTGYYQDFGTVEHLAGAWERGMTYAGEFSKFRNRRHGRPLGEFEPHRIVVCAQNHDQIGNRPQGERLSALVDFESQKLAVAVGLLSPYVPLIFMGQEHGETAPFQFFVSHGDPGLADAVRRGRKADFRGFGWTADAPDPQCEDTCHRCILDRARWQRRENQLVYALHRRLLQVRKRIAAQDRDQVTPLDQLQLLIVLRGQFVLMLFHFAKEMHQTSHVFCGASWTKILDSAESEWGGPGSALPMRIDRPGPANLTLSPRSFSVYVRADDEEIDHRGSPPEAQE